uniref:ZFP37 zinc finger protein n=1 Tax=Rousettus aegyptiacus TaxID=9407 RepID=A0A7J8IWL6_ROUAE|nr:ZFP37 zinc finger protein [Rousettus aegyptiacus]
MGATRSCSEEPVQGCDAGELQQPCLNGISSCQTRHDLQVGKRRRAMAGEGEKAQTGWSK